MITLKGKKNLPVERAGTAAAACSMPRISEPYIFLTPCDVAGEMYTI